jgi:hypothetical protein
MKSEFLGEPVIDEYLKFRRCSKCGKVQEFSNNSQGGWWQSLNKQRTEIFNTKYQQKGKV